MGKVTGEEKEHLWMVAYKLQRELESLYVWDIHGSHSSILARTATYLSRGVLQCSATPASSRWDQLWKKAILAPFNPVPSTQIKYKEKVTEKANTTTTLSGNYHYRDLHLNHFGSNQINPEQQLQVLWCSFSTPTLHCEKKKCNNEQASVSRTCSYLLSLILYHCLNRYICQVFATGEALA